MIGSVTAFDEAAGIGEVTSSGGNVCAFQCTEIADGTRTIVRGTSVVFTTRRKLGRVEAFGITPL